MLCNKSCNKCVVTLHYFAYLLGKLDDTKYRGRDSSGIDYKGTSRYYISRLKVVLMEAVINFTIFVKILWPVPQGEISKS